MPAKKEEVVFDPKDFRAYLARRMGKAAAELSVPADVVFTYDTRIFRAAIAESRATPAEWYIYTDRLYLGKIGNKEVGIAHAMVGASAAAMNLEELIAYGARRIYELGVAGAIDSALSPGDVVVLKGAFSNEGTSKHYFRGKSWFGSSRSLSERLEKSLQGGKVKFVRANAWSIDAPYRETKKKVVHYRKVGVRVVNMESSAIFAVAAYRAAKAASVQIVSDVVSEKGWEPAFHSELVNKRRGEILSAVLLTIKTIPN
jgi:uridine phosphorylase